MHLGPSKVPDSYCATRVRVFDRSFYGRPPSGVLMGLAKGYKRLCPLLEISLKGIDGAVQRVPAFELFVL